MRVLFLILLFHAGFVSGQNCSYDLVIYPDQHGPKKVERYGAMTFDYNSDTTGISQKEYSNLREIKKDSIKIGTGCGLKLMFVVLQSGDEFMYIYLHNIPLDYSAVINHLPFIPGVYHFDVQKFLSEHDDVCDDCLKNEKADISTITTYWFDPKTKSYQLIYCPFLF